MNFSVLDSCLQSQAVPLAVCMPEDQASMAAVAEAAQLGFVTSICVGNPDIMENLRKSDFPDFRPTMVAAATPEDAAAKTIDLVRNGQAKAVMKGSISTPILLKALLDSEKGIKRSSVLSHVLVYEWEGKFRFLTDGGMLPHPTLAEKQEILTNAVWLAQRLGTEQPKVAVLSAVEKVNYKIPSSVDAAVLSKMAERQQLGNCLVEGPLALDNAISLESAHHKGLFNEVVGQADILVVPDLDTGNILGKSIMYLGNLPVGGLIVGAQVPVILLSRADSRETRLNSIKLALVAGCCE